MRRSVSVSPARIDLMFQRLKEQPDRGRVEILLGLDQLHEPLVVGKHLAARLAALREQAIHAVQVLQKHGAVCVGNVQLQRRDVDPSGYPIRG